MLLTGLPFLGIRSIFGCVAQEIHLACPSNKTIFIEHADYGQYSQTCDEGTCCAPHPYDCTQSMEENDVAEWLLLKLQCDNRTECSYLVKGSIFTDDVCAPVDSVAYLEIDYTCFPGKYMEHYFRE